jgi:hypothetical protein
MKYKIQCTFTCEVEADSMDVAFVEAGSIYTLNEWVSDAVIAHDDGFEMEAEEINPLTEYRDRWSSSLVPWT